MNLCSWNSHLQSTLSTHRSTMTQTNHRCLLNCRATISTLIISCRPFADPGSSNYAAVPVGSFPMQMGVPAGAPFPAGTEARPMRKAGFMRGTCLLFFSMAKSEGMEMGHKEASGLRYKKSSRWHYRWQNWKMLIDAAHILGNDFLDRTA